MNKSNLVVWFKDLGKEDIPIVGGKCANLRELPGKIGVPVANVPIHPDMTLPEELFQIDQRVEEAATSILNAFTRGKKPV